MDYKLTRSSRRTVSISINKNAEVEVRAPLKMSAAEVDRIVNSKQKWITEHRRMKLDSNEQRAEFKLNFGDKLTLRGVEYVLEARQESLTGFDGVCFYAPDGCDSAQLKTAVVKVYKLIADKLIKSRVAYYAEKMSVTPAAVKINSAKTRWGSCSGRDSINFSWRLVMAGDDIVDYVVVHELAHIKEHNHSDNFWAEVGKVMPDYKARQQGLKVLQKKLSVEDWD